MRRLAVKIQNDANDGHIGLVDRRGKPPTRFGSPYSLYCAYAPYIMYVLAPMPLVALLFTFSSFLSLFFFLSYL